MQHLSWGKPCRCSPQKTPKTQQEFSLQSQTKFTAEDTQSKQEFSLPFRLPFVVFLFFVMDSWNVQRDCPIETLKFPHAVGSKRLQSIGGGCCRNTRKVQDVAKG